MKRPTQLEDHELMALVEDDPDSDGTPEHKAMLVEYYRTVEREGLLDE